MARGAPGARGVHGQLSPHLLRPRPLHQDSRASGRTWQGSRICLPKARSAVLRTAAWSCHGPPASSAGSKGTARCNQDSPPHSVPGHLSTSPADKRENGSRAYSRVLSEQWCLAAGRGALLCCTSQANWGLVCVPQRASALRWRRHVGFFALKMLRILTCWNWETGRTPLQSFSEKIRMAEGRKCFL